MVAKLAKPVKIIPNYPINFLVKYDVLTFQSNIYIKTSTRRQKNGRRRRLTYK